MAIHIDVIGIVVADMARSLAFYRELGLAVPPEADAEPHAELALANGLRLTWDTVGTIQSFDAGWQPPSGGHGRVGLGHDGHLPPWDAFWGQRYAVVHDPDGNTVDLYAALPE